MKYAWGVLLGMALLTACATRREPPSMAVPTPQDAPRFEWRECGIIRGPKDSRRLALMFTGHEFAEGGETILSHLSRRKARASFFLTGDFLDNPAHANLLRRMIREGHYIGPHSDKHLLYCPWSGPKVTLLSRDEFRADLEANLDKIVRFGVSRERARHFVPPYEWYNEQIVEWSRELGFTLVNFTPGTRSTADYTGEADSNFVPSQAIFESILAREAKDPDGLNGFLLLLHIGAGPGRADKFHARFGELLDTLADKGYEFARVDELLSGQGELSPSGGNR